MSTDERNERNAYAFDLLLEVAAAEQAIMDAGARLRGPYDRPYDQWTTEAKAEWATLCDTLWNTKSRLLAFAAKEGQVSNV